MQHTARYYLDQHPGQILKKCYEIFYELSEKCAFTKWSLMENYWHLATLFGVGTSGCLGVFYILF